MSIIHDALKKAQENLERLESKKNPNSPPVAPAINPSGGNVNMVSPNPPHVKDNKFWYKIITLLICACLILIGTILTVVLKSNKGPNISKNQNSGAQTSINTANPIAATVDKLIGKEPAAKIVQPATTESSVNELVLEGTMIMGDKKVALISGGVYEIGDKVGDKRVLGITFKEVELFDNGQIITIRAKTK